MPRAVSSMISHQRAEETPEAKARWFQRLPMQERMRLLCEYTDLMLALQPHLAERSRDAQPTQRRVRVLTPP